MNVAMTGNNEKQHNGCYVWKKLGSSSYIQVPSESRVIQSYGFQQIFVTCGMYSNTRLCNRSRPGSTLPALPITSCVLFSSHIHSLASGLLRWLSG